jgi:hypothetical protein
MNKKLIFVLNALLLASLSSGDVFAEDWKKVDTDEAGWESFVDYSTIKNNGQYRQAWQMEASTRSERKSAPYLVEHDCAKERSRIVFREPYIWSGGVPQPIDHSWYYAKPGSASRAILRAVCDRWLLW